mgnify:CR=1 FL=1
MNIYQILDDKKMLTIIISVFINILLISSTIVIGILYMQKEEIQYNSDTPIEVDDETTITDNFFVEVKGAVKNPGVYSASSSNIINDIINLAGGFNNNAYTNNINLSKRVSDELVIYVYTKYEYQANNKKDEKKDCVCPTYDISDCTNNTSSIIVPDSSNKNEDSNSASSESNSKQLININTASKNELKTLSGIGDAKADAIIEYRSKNAFTKIEDIKNVSGIGEAAFEKIKDHITI